MDHKWIGYDVSIDCGDVLGIYQGKVSNVNSIDQSISLVKSYRNGIECTVPEITIRAQDIQDLKILNKNDSKVNELKGNELNLAKLLSKTCLEEKKKQQTFTESCRKPTTPKKGENRKKLADRDEACFSEPISNYILETEFDFEKNLALFNKQEVFHQINAASKPDVVSDSARKNYRCDENVIEQGNVVFRQINVPHPDSKEYSTDMGLIVPTLQPELRRKLFTAAEEHGLSTGRMVDMVGRAASEMVVQLLGGGHRLNPHNTHQAPVVVVLCGAHFQGELGVNCARHLSNKGARVLLFMPLNVKISPQTSSELELFKLTDGRHTGNIKDLPVDVVDIVISAMDDHTMNSQGQLWVRAAASWATQCRAPILALDPPPEGASLIPKWSIAVGLPLSLESAGAVYLCDLGIPKKIFAQVGIQYASPFGAKFLIPLHKK